MPTLKIVLAKQAIPQDVSPEVYPEIYLILSRAVPMLDGWLAELCEAEKALALISALSAYLDLRRQAFQASEPPEPKVNPGA